MFLEYPLVPVLFKFIKNINTSNSSVIALAVKDRNGWADKDIQDETKP